MAQRTFPGDLDTSLPSSMPPSAHGAEAHTGTIGTPAQVGLGNVKNLDQTDPANVVQDESHRFVTDDQISAWNGATGGGGVPTGTGFRHVTADVEDATAKLVKNADVDPAAAITESKLGLNYPTHSSANDPTADQKAALAGTNGTPGGTNKFVTNSDPRNTDARAPSIHGSGYHTGIIGTWAQIDKTVSNLGDLTTKSHTSLTDIGTKPHSEIDGFINGFWAYNYWSNSANPAGWSSFYYKDIYYKKLGSLVFVTFYLHGECNSAAASFTLPFTSNAPGFHQGIVLVEDNYSWQAGPGMFEIVQGTNTVHFYKNCAKAGFTASGQKGVAGQFWYEATS